MPQLSPPDIYPQANFLRSSFHDNDGGHPFAASARPKCGCRGLIYRLGAAPIMRAEADMAPGNCGYTISLRQCLATLAGNGGVSCQSEPALFQPYPPPPTPSPPIPAVTLIHPIRTAREMLTAVDV